MATEANNADDLRTLLNRFIDEVINGRDLDAGLTELVIEDFVEQNPLPGQGLARDEWGWPTSSRASWPASLTCTGRSTKPLSRATASWPTPVGPQPTTASSWASPRLVVRSLLRPGLSIVTATVRWSRAE